MSNLEPQWQKDIVKRLAKKHNLSEETIKTIVYSQFKLVAKVMKEGKFEKILLNGFGTFSVRPGRVESVNSNKRKHEERKHHETD